MNYCGSQRYRLSLSTASLRLPITLSSTSMDGVISHVCQWCVPTIMSVGAPSSKTLHIQAELSVRPSAEQGHSHIQAKQMVRTLGHTDKMRIPIRTVM
jgi:hypothetical protein